MSRIRVVAETTSWKTREADPDDSWDRGDTTGRVTNVHAEVAEGETVSSYGSSWTIDLERVEAGDTVYAVVAGYESGDTFGRDGGYAQIMGVFSVEDHERAQALLVACEAYRDRRNQVLSHGLQFEGQTIYADWFGYFEVLEELRIWHVPVSRGEGSVTS